MVRGSTLGWENNILMSVSWCLSRGGGGATNLSGIGTKGGEDTAAVTCSFPTSTISNVTTYTVEGLK